VGYCYNITSHSELDERVLFLTAELNQRRKLILAKINACKGEVETLKALKA